MAPVPSPSPESGPADPRWYVIAIGRTTAKLTPDEMSERFQRSVARSASPGVKFSETANKFSKSPPSGGQERPTPSASRSSRSGRFCERSHGSPSRPDSHVLCWPCGPSARSSTTRCSDAPPLRALRRPGRSLARQEACDADPMLLRAAKHHGEPSTSIARV
jgi:hypothetical protein